MGKTIYNPLDDSIYMSKQMMQFFKHRLHEELEKLDEEIAFFFSMRADSYQPLADPLDQGTTESLQQISRAFYEHEKILSQQVELALRRLAFGTYGYCVITGEPIGVPRLMAAPHTPYCLDAQENKEHSRYKH